MSPKQPRTSSPEFTPPRCPHPACSAHQPGATFRWRRKGSFTRACDLRVVQRFRCLECERGFSTQTFRLDYRLKRPDLLVPVFKRLCDKSSLRRIARELGTKRRLVEHRLGLIGRHCEDHQKHHLGRIREKGGIQGPFLLDELETFEQDRKLKPVTVPMLIAGESWFLLHVETAPLPPRGRLTKAEEARKLRNEALEGKRVSGSAKAVRNAFEVLLGVVPKEGEVRVITDLKSSYASTLRDLFGDRLVHEQVSSKVHRGTQNPLFPINHTLARYRDLSSRLVRRSWCASKCRHRLELHLWVVLGFRNYVDGWRSEPAWKQATSAAEQAGFGVEKLSAERFLTWRDPLAA